MVNALLQAVQAVRQVPRAMAALVSVEEPGRPQHGRKRALRSVRVALCTRERSGADAAQSPVPGLEHGHELRPTKLLTPRL